MSTASLLVLVTPVPLSLARAMLRSAAFEMGLRKSVTATPALKVSPERARVNR